MAFLTWLNANANSFSLQLTAVKGLDALIPGLYDFLVAMTWSGKPFYGRGKSFDKEAAMRAACGEAVERAAFAALRESCSLRTTSGLALHSDAAEAAERAVAELVERDSFFCHYLSRMPFGAFNLDSLEDKRFEGALAAFNNQGVVVRLGQMVAPAPWHAVIAAAFGPNYKRHPFGVVIGLGCARSLDEACRKALLECLPNTWHVMQGETKSLSAKDFLALPQHRPEHHGAWALTLEMGALLDNYFGELPTAEKSPFSTAQEISVSSLSLPAWLQEAPVALMQAHSPHVQELFFGPTRQDQVNFERLMEFAGKKFNFSELETRPHPLA